MVETIFRTQPPRGRLQEDEEGGRFWYVGLSLGPSLQSKVAVQRLWGPTHTQCCLAKPRFPRLENGENAAHLVGLLSGGREDVSAYCERGHTQWAHHTPQPSPGLTAPSPPTPQDPVHLRRPASTASGMPCPATSVLPCVSCLPMTRLSQLCPLPECAPFPHPKFPGCVIHNTCCPQRGSSPSKGPRIGVPVFSPACVCPYGGAVPIVLSHSSTVTPMTPRAPWEQCPQVLCAQHDVWLPGDIQKCLFKDRPEEPG